MPVRIQRRRVKGWKMPENTVYVGRPGKFGNPFFIGHKIPDTLAELLDKHDYFHFMKFNCGYVDEPEHAVGLFEKYILPKLDLTELQGKDLACWCPLDKPCHADVLLKFSVQPSIT